MLRIGAVVLSLAAASPVPLTGQPPSQRPNVVLIMTDDAGYADFGSYGATDVRTPNIDGLARDGVRFTDFYANGPTCTPTRAALISGRYQQRVQLDHPLGMMGAEDLRRGLPVTGTSLPQRLRQAGYRTALVGKWHLGWLPEFSPNRHGFDYFFGFKAGFIDFYQHTAPGGADLWENDAPVVVSGYMTDLITERSIRFMEEHAREPFFIDVAYNAPHWPYQVPDQPSVARDGARHLTAIDDPTGTRADYVAMVERVDRGVGEILAALDRLGLRDNTIVIFTNDNGGEWLSDGGPLFHHKRSVWEGGIRVPAIIRWPGRIPRGSVSRQVGITMDLTASILAVTGAGRRPDPDLDGIDLFPILTGQAPEVERTLFWRADPRIQQWAVRSGSWKLVWDAGRLLLFDLEADLGERRNLIREHPEVARRLHEAQRAWEGSVGARPGS